MRNFAEEIENMDGEKMVEVPGMKIRGHLDTWSKDLPVSNEEEINAFAVSYFLSKI
jgi:hypothetical protein